MTRQLVFVHGRSQEHRDAAALKAEWVEAWKQGLAKNGLTLPISDEEIRFPYYGQTLFDLVKGASGGAVSDVIVRGEDLNEGEARFIGDFVLELQSQCGITDLQVQELAADAIIERGPLNWKWVRLVLQALDTHVPGASSTSISLATRDVYLYLRNPGLQNVIDTGIRRALTPGVETVVVGHSLGSVVSYNLLRRDGRDLGWKVPLYVTLGSPLAVTAVRDALRPLAHPGCVTKWWNALDSRDVVALYPLDAPRFAVTPSIENKTDVDNPTENRHGISGYLSDPVVAKRIYDALTA
ncbi:MAG: alpha/beta hydrolase [Planctomycetota bacterium]